jgi:hypothetical protein
MRDGTEMIIGLSGYAQTGKDTIADYLISDYGFVRVAFADPIREALYKLDPKVRLGESAGVSIRHAVDNVGWEEVKKLSSDTRELLQRLGTEVGREMFGETFWVDKAMEKARKHERVVFTDVRYPNELETVLRASGAVWRVVKDSVSAVNRHLSETALDHYQFQNIIFNNGTKEDLYGSVDLLMR